MTRKLLFVLVLLAFCCAPVFGEGSTETPPKDDATKTVAPAASPAPDAEKKPEPATSEAIGHVSKLSGSAKLTRADAAQTVTVGMKIQEGDHFKTDAKSYVVILLYNEPGDDKATQNASELTIAENTTMKIQKRKKEVNGDTTTKVTIEEGKVDSKVEDGRKTKWLERRDRDRTGTKPSTKGKSNYEIETPTAVAGVRGTEFIVAVTPQKTFVYVKDGIVWVKDRVSGDIREIKRYWLLEIGISGFGAQTKAADSEREAMENMNFSGSFSPFIAAIQDRIEREREAGSPDVDRSVKEDVEDRQGRAGSTADNDSAPTPVDPGAAIENNPPTPHDPGNLPDPPSPPPAP
jgi:hypothetical protein